MLKKQREEVRRALAYDQRNLDQIRARLQKSQAQADKALLSIQNKGEVLEQYETLLAEGEEAYMKVVENAGKLVTCLNMHSQDTLERFSYKG